MRNASFRKIIAIPLGLILLSLIIAPNWKVLIGIELDMFRWLWVFYALLGVALFLATCWFRPFPIHKPPASVPGATNEQDPIPPVARNQDSIISAKRSLGYGEPIWIDTRDDEGIPDDALPKTAIQRKTPDRSRNDVAFQEISLTRPDGTDLVLTAMVLFDRKSWKMGTAHLLEGESPQGISPTKAIRNSDIEADVRQSLALYCVGLASTEFELTQAEDNTVLSDNRAIRLCNTLHELNYIHAFTPIRTVAVGLGERIPDRDDQTPAQRQRAAVIISAKQLDNIDTERDVIDAFRHGLDVVSVSLAKYRRSDGAVFKMFDVTGAEFCESTSDLWEDVEDLTSRRVLCRDQNQENQK